MSDFSSSLPVRTQTNGDVAAFIADGTTPSQVAAVDTHGSLSSMIKDASGNAVTTQTSGSQRALDVGIDVAGVQVDPRAIRALTSADVVTANQGGGPWTQNLTQVGGSAISLGQTTMSASVPVVIASNQSAVPVSGTVAVTQSTSPWATSDAADGSVTGGTAGTKSLLIGVQYNTALPALTNTQQAAAQADSSGRLLIGSIASALPAGAANIGKVSIQDSSGNPFSPTNPLFVTMSDTVGTSVDNYNTSASLAAAGTSNHDYTVTAAKTFYAKQIWASASGKLKIEVQLETGAATNTFNSFWVGFNSTSNPNILVPVPTNKTQVAGARIRVIRTNEDKASMDVYSTISGTEQ